MIPSSRPRASDKNELRGKMCTSQLSDLTLGTICCTVHFQLASVHPLGNAALHRWFQPMEYVWPPAHFNFQKYSLVAGAEVRWSHRLSAGKS